MARCVPNSEQTLRGGQLLRVIIGISGASGSIYGVRLIEKLRRRPEVELHLVMTRSGERTLFLETGKKPAELRSLVHAFYPIDDVGAAPASVFSIGTMAAVTLLSPNRIKSSSNR
jgi:3-polyprenyl-4-hydroxybenzoate decarboxylase